ncbi:MAG: phenylacetate--CoA ligase [Theionarchaea archaeon]|nr:phenylacetate--CoA ligase [Theionarchaea archaeon]
MSIFWNEKIETMPVRDLQTLQMKKLKAQVAHVFENNPVYRSKFKKAGITPDDITTLTDIEKIPFSVKDELRAQYPIGLQCAPQEQVVRYHMSSGTTGKPICCGYTRQDLEIWSDMMARAFCAAGGGQKDIFQNAYGYGLFTGGLGFHYGAEKVGMSVIPTAAGNTSRQIMIMKDMKTTILGCTPSYAQLLGETLSREGCDVEHELFLRIGLFGAEPWTEELRDRMDKTLGLSAHGGGAFDHYGLTEMCGPGVATECQNRCGLHIWADHFLVEIIDPDSGEPVNPGEKGELVITTLSKQCTPFLRYRTRDITILHEELCECGRTHPRIEKIMGRSDDMLIIRGVNVFPSQIEYVLLQHMELAEPFQIIINKSGPLDRLLLKVEQRDTIPLLSRDDLQEILEAELKDSLQISVQVIVEAPNTLPRFEGKARRIIDNRS